MTQRLFDTIWGSTGTVIDPGNTKLNLGWEDEIPRFEWENYWHERVDEQAQYLQQTGVGEWMATVTYVLDAIVMHNGALFQSQQAGNVANTPGASTTFWRMFGEFSLLPRGHIDGLLASNNSGAPNGTIDLSPGSCRSLLQSGFSAGMGTDVSVSKKLGGVWVDGPGAFGREPSISLTANTWYRFMTLGKPNGSLDSGFTSVADADGSTLLASANVLAAGYTWARQVQWILTDGSSNIVPFYVSPSDPDFVLWGSPFLDTSVAGGGGGAWTNLETARDTTAPPGSIAKLSHYYHWPGSGSPAITAGLIISPYSVAAVSPATPSATPFGYLVRRSSTESNHSFHVDVEVDSSSQYRWHCSHTPGSSSQLFINTLGYRYRRGV